MSGCKKAAILRGDWTIPRTCPECGIAGRCRPSVSADIRDMPWPEVWERGEKVKGWGAPPKTEGQLEALEGKTQTEAMQAAIVDAKPGAITYPKDEKKLGPTYSITETANGGFVLSDGSKGTPWPITETYAFSTPGDLIRFLMDNYRKPPFKVSQAVRDALEGGAGY